MKLAKMSSLLSKPLFANNATTRKTNTEIQVRYAHSSRHCSLFATAKPIITILTMRYGMSSIILHKTIKHIFNSKKLVEFFFSPSVWEDSCDLSWLRVVTKRKLWKTTDRRIFLYPAIEYRELRIIRIISFLWAMQKDTNHFYFGIVSTIIASTGIILFFPFLLFSSKLGTNNNIGGNIAAQGFERQN